MPHYQIRVDGPSKPSIPDEILAHDDSLPFGNPSKHRREISYSFVESEGIRRINAVFGRNIQPLLRSYLYLTDRGRFYGHRR